MTCQETRIQAYIDGELTREERKELARHLEHCKTCQTQLAELKRLDQWVGDALHDALAPEPGVDSLSIDVDAAWVAFEAKRQARDTLHEQITQLPLQPQIPMRTHATAPEKPVPATAHSVLGRWSIMAKTYQKWLIGGAAAAVVCGALTIPQVQAATTNFLQLFRVEKIQMVEFNAQDLNDIKNFISSGKIGKKDLQGLGSISVDGDQAVKPKHFATVDAAQQAGLQVPAAPNGYHVTDVSLSPGRTMHAQLNVDKLNSLLQELNSGVTFDPALNNKQFSVSWPQEVDTTLVPDAAANSSVKLTYAETESPKLAVPEGVDINQLRDNVLKLPFIPDHIKQQLASIDDWQKTLPVPYMEGNSNTQKVTVNGADGVFLSNPNNNTGLLVWPQNGKVYRLQATGWTSQQGDLQQALLALASHLQ